VFIFFFWHKDFEYIKENYSYQLTQDLYEHPYIYSSARDVIYVSGSAYNEKYTQRGND